ncbi:MAG: hypothetical protein QOE84_2048 [Actinomycetota bacterium]|jgi:hypothetical protein|nr:hypothetical protein [Actinomycetota bacterium]
MTRNRWTGLAGLLFGLAFLSISIFGPSTPDSSGTDAATKFASYWNDNGHQNKARIGILLVSYAVVLLLAFSAGLRDRLRTVDTGPLPSFCLAAGTAAASLLAASAASSFCVGLTAADNSSFKVDGSLAIALDQAGYALFATGLMAAGAMAVSTGIVTLRTRVLPVWTAWVGFLLGLGVVGSLFTAWTGFILLPIWSICVGVVLLLRPVDVPAAPAT